MTAISEPDQLSLVRPSVAMDVGVGGHLGPDSRAAVVSEVPPSLIEDQSSLGDVDLRDELTKLAALRTERRLDVSNVSVDQGLARAGACGFVHLDTGRVCQLVRNHPESCEFRLRAVSVSGFIAAEGRGLHTSCPSWLWPSSEPTAFDLLQIELSICTDADPPDTLVRLRGEVDILTAPGLRAVLEECVEADASNLLLDLGGLAVIDARGLSVLVEIRRRLRLQHRELILRSPSPFTVRLIEAAGLSGVGLDLCQLGTEDPPSAGISSGTSVPGLRCPCCRGREFEVVAEIDLSAFRCLDCGCRWHVQLGFVRRFPGSTTCTNSSRVPKGHTGRSPARDPIPALAPAECSSRDKASSGARGSGGAR